eukprot:GAFH01002556.1.p1 GENE.GAFH01002556.1~~GAFH01002556.1.p1  ORF type:complete len:320 (+),score=36.97 GAFH01002556.1:124-960(+)
MAKIRDRVETHPYIAMDTEFPGVVARPVGSTFKSDYQYQKLRLNVDILKIIQLGLTFANDQGDMVPDSCTWQFNFRFNINEDTYAQDSIELLQTAGIDFDKHMKQGIDVTQFAELLTASGVVLNDGVHWITFHSGYDFGYLLKILTCKPLPEGEAEFFELLNRFFPCIYDLKVLTNTKRGLNHVAEEMQVHRIGPNHQAGSDSLLTCGTFFQVKQQLFKGAIDDKFLGQICGLGECSSRFESAYSPSDLPIVQHGAVGAVGAGGYNAPLLDMSSSAPA